MKERSKAGAVISLVGAVIGIIGVFVVFMLAYEPMMLVQMAVGRPDEATIVEYFIPFLSDIGIIAGALWAVAAYGFFKNERWAWTVAVIANVISLLTGFFGMIPAMSKGQFPLFLAIFLPSLITYLLLLAYVRQVNAKIIAVSLLSGMTFVMAFMNGVASTDKIIINDNPIFVAVQRVNWVASLGWGVFTVALVTRRKWTLPVGLGAGLLTLTAGTPLAVVTTIEAGRFSMFSPAAILALVLLVIFFVPAGNRMLTQWLDGPASQGQVAAED